MDLEPGDADKPVSHSANSRFSMRGCRITRSQLRRIWRLATEDFPESAHVTISTKRATGEVETEIKAKSIDDLLTGIQRSTIAGDPDRLDNLNLMVFSSYPDEDRTVRISVEETHAFFPGRVSVSVSGTDSGWTRGRAAGLKDLFAEVQSPWWTGRGAIRSKLIASSVILAAFINDLLYFVIKPHISTTVFVLIIAASYAILVGGALFAGSILRRRYRTQLLLTPDTSDRPIDKMAILTLIVTVIGVGVAIAAIMVAHSDAVHPHG